MNRIYDLLWLVTIATVCVLISLDSFIYLTKSHTVTMGFLKFFILATMGEILGRRLEKGLWQFKNINILQRAFTWGMFGVMFTYVFPIYSHGVDGLILSGRVPFIFDPTFTKAFYKSIFMNILFAFPMMSFHKFTDILIDQNKLFSRWDIYKTFCLVDWENMWRKVAPTILWFWIPAHTITFCLAEEYRIIMAAFLGVVLGLILSFKKDGVNKTTNPAI